MVTWLLGDPAAHLVPGVRDFDFFELSEDRIAWSAGNGNGGPTGTRTWGADEADSTTLTTAVSGWEIAVSGDTVAYPTSENGFLSLLRWTEGDAAAETVWSIPLGYTRDYDLAPLLSGNRIIFGGNYYLEQPVGEGEDAIYDGDTGLLLATRR